MTLSRWPALNVKVMEIHTSADPAVLWLRARQLCYLGGHASQSCESIGLLKLKDDMPLEADEEDRKSDHMQPLRKVKGFFDRTSWKVSDVQIVRYTWVSVAKDNRTVPWLISSAVSSGELELKNSIR